MTSATTKRLGVAMVLIGAPLLHFAVPGAFWDRTSAALAGGLMMVFFSREAIHDERVDMLKLKAISAAFSVSFTVTLILNWLLNRDFDITRDFSGTAWRSITAFRPDRRDHHSRAGAVSLLAPCGWARRVGGREN